MIFAHVKIIQEGEAALFYRFDRKLNGYMIAGLFIAPNMPAKMAFGKVWKYFVSAVVQADDIYCSVPIGIENSMFDNYLDYYDTINGLKIYKVDNFLKEQYSSYEQHKKITKERAKTL
jgi:hypothetical protein